MDRQTVRVGEYGEFAQIEGAIAIVGKNRLAVVAALDQVVWKPRSRQARQASHLRWRRLRRRKLESDPNFLI
jgi:hypothetical protein